ncbi:MAG: flagellar biosynthesis protein FliQ [Pseudomonadota bacterium]
MPEYFIAVAKQSLFLALVLTGPPVLVAMLVGLTISILQATTQIQEQTLTFVPKLFAIVATLAIAGPWMLAQLVAFTASIYGSFATYVH